MHLEVLEVHSHYVHGNQIAIPKENKFFLKQIFNRRAIFLKKGPQIITLKRDKNCKCHFFSLFFLKRESYLYRVKKSIKENQSMLLTILSA